MLRMALPAVVGQIINQLYNVVDRIYIGPGPGEDHPVSDVIAAAVTTGTFLTFFHNLMKSRTD